MGVKEAHMNKTIVRIRAILHRPLISLSWRTYLSAISCHSKEWVDIRSGFLQCSEGQKGLLYNHNPVPRLL